MTDRREKEFLKRNSSGKTTNTLEILASLIIIFAGFVVVIANISNGSDRFSLDRLGVWYDVILVAATIICICCNIKYESHSFVSWIKANWYLILYLILRISSGVANGVINNEWFILIVCSEVFLLFAVNSSTAKSITIRVTLCMVVAFDLIVVSLCIYHYFFYSEQMQSILDTYVHGRINIMPFSMVFYNPNSAGLFAGLTAIILISAFVKGYQRSLRFLFIPLILVNIVFAWWANCRTALAGIAAVCIVIVLKRLIRAADYQRLIMIALI
jgi:hypothetical protein